MAVTALEDLVVGMRSVPGRLYYRHTVASQLEQVEILTDVRPTIALVDRGYAAFKRRAEPSCWSAIHHGCRDH